MKKVMIMVAVVAMLVATASPAFAGDNDRHDHDNDLDFNQINANDLEDFLDDFESNDGDEQEADSGDISQVYTIVNTGDNANQCVGIDSNANTGNSQSQLSLDGSGEVDDSGSSLDVFGNSTTTCDQQVNQVALATPTYY